MHIQIKLVISESSILKCFYKQKMHCEYWTTVSIENLVFLDNLGIKKYVDPSTF